MDAPDVAVVVPTLDEEEVLARHLPGLLETAGEVVVSDGGSRDSTVELARRLGARVVTGPAGRGGQLNRGAAATRAAILLFLHADTRLPADGLALVRAAIAGGAAGGGFAVAFDSDAAVMRLAARLINLRCRLTRVPLGDQAQFVRRDAFLRLGGFRDWAILEDLDFGRRLKASGPTTLLAAEVTTAARRFRANGVARTVATNWLIWGLYFGGVPAPRLARLYRKIR